MPRSPQDIIREHCHPLDPRPTGESPVFCELTGIRAVLFDVYGTMLISASGDVGTSIDQAQAEAFSAAIAAAGPALSCDGGRGADCLREKIHRTHQGARAKGIEYPEVDIVKVWRDTVTQMQHEGLLPPNEAPTDWRRLALEYEVRVNPVWPMPGLVACLERLRSRDMTLGIVSNAQFFTPELFPALMGRSLDDLGFDPHIQLYSYRRGLSKPGTQLYQMAVEALSSRGIRADETLYVGNDMLNDVTPASAVGMRTALFAGDARSLRRRTDDPRVAGVAPDVVITQLSQLAAMLASQ